MPAVSTRSILFSFVKTYSTRLLFAAWLTGSVLLLAKMLISLRSLRRLEENAVPAQSSLKDACASHALATGILRPVRVYVASAEQDEVSPMTWGFLRPLILLPQDADAWSEQRLRAVLLHELAHIGRHDWAAQIITGIVRACYWFHPLVWFLSEQIHRESEQACDDRVLSFGMNAPDYAAHLLEIVRMRKTNNALPSAAISMAQPSLLETRLRALLDTRRSHRPLTRGAVLLSLLCLALVVLPLAAARVAANHAPAIHLPSAVLLPESGPAESPISGSPTSSLPETALPSAVIAATTTAPVSTETLRQPSDAAIAWGKAVRGLQAGLEINGGLSSIHLGQHVEFTVHLRNAGNKPLTLQYPASKEKITVNPFVWNAITENDKKVTIYRENAYIDSDRAERLLLQPGEERTLPGVPLKFHTASMGNGSIVEQTVFLAPGIVTFQAVPFPLSHYRDDWVGKVRTGVVKLNVGPTIEGNALPDAASKIPRGLNGIHWGTPEKGLEAGIRIEGNQRRFTEGQTVQVTTFVRNNTNHRLPFAYSYCPSRVWDSTGKPIETSRNEPMLGGLPGATLLIIPPGETLALPSELKIIGAVGERESVYSSLVEPKTGTYRIGQMFQIPWAELKNTQTLLDKNDPIYRTHVTLLNAKGEPYTARAVITGADSVGIDWNRDHAPTPEISAANSNAATLWTDFAEFEVMAKGGANLNGIQWGKAADGLQAGIHIKGTQKHFRPGGRVPVECFLRNTTDHEIAFTYTAGYYANQLPTVINAANPATEKKVKGVFLTGIDAALTIILKPGETVVFPHPGVGLGEKQEKVPEPNNLPKGLEQFPYLEEPTPGSYQIKQTFVYNLTTIEKAQEIMTHSHEKPAMIEPMAVKLIKPDGTSYTGEVTVIPAYALKSVLMTGEVGFDIAGKTLQ